MRTLVGAAVGFAAGYSLMRALECRAQGVPLSVAFALDPKVLLTPVAALVGYQGVPLARNGNGQPPQLLPAPPQQGPVTPDAVYDPDAVLTPDWAR